MARYDSEGYRADGRRQILGYSRQVQGGIDEARARASQRRAEGWNPAMRFARQRERRVAEAKMEGTFDETRDAYNKEASPAGVEMDKAGTIRRKPTPVLEQENKYVKPAPARATPMSLARPASQRLAETVGMTTGEGLLDMARKARRRGTLVIK